MNDLTHHANARRRALQVNERQQRFYEQEATKSLQTNILTSIWAGRRKAMEKFHKQMGVHHTITQFQRERLGCLDGCNVLDLGCSSGCKVSIDMAARCQSYVGVDLSESRIATLNGKLEDRGLVNAEAFAFDFLSPDFPWGPFDIIFANSVVHHFEDFDMCLSLMHDRLVPGGRIICCDPLNTSLPVRLARRLCRPFQADADWEWPFTKRSLQRIERYFHIEAMQGVFGLSKWAFIAANLPFTRKASVSMGRAMHQLDVKWANRKGRALWRCMSVVMCLRRRDIEPTGLLRG